MKTPATSTGKSPGRAARELAEFGHRGGLHVLAQLAPLRVVPWLACELRQHDPAGLCLCHYLPCEAAVALNCPRAMAKVL